MDTPCLTARRVAAIGLKRRSAAILDALQQDHDTAEWIELIARSVDLAADALLLMADAMERLEEGG